MEKKIKIRNLEGKLICEAVYVGNQWLVTIKNHGCFTTLHLLPSGVMEITGYTMQE